MNYQTIIYDVKSHIGYIILNRPEVMNAINYQMTSEIIDACEQVRRAPEVRVVILTGAGEKAFCTGLDLKERAKETDETTLFDKRRARNLPGIHSHHQAVAAIDKPTIAAVRGWTVAGGLELALACDIRVAAEDAKLGMMEVRRGRLGGAGGTQRLPRLIGTAKALEICLTGEPINAAEAYRVGLVNRVVPADQLMSTAEEIAGKICLGAPLSLIAIKEAITRGVELPLEEGLKLESELAMLLSNTEDQKEGSRAFAEKRPPQWKGR
ncbi:MAG: enoyl-CoA hydratase/isomerase family protein [Deltaproteobacteria bacterium]|nr:enoyl-CoA hydratase/isomerase family protein [Deltaproteobacteria bacterium]